MNYEECLLYLEKIQNLGIKFGLDNVRTVLSALGNPHQKYPSVLVAGTNGKGSVCAMLSRVLAQHDFRAGLYTSPHLARVEERIRIDHEPISPQDFSRNFTVLKEKIEELIAAKKLLSLPTYFEWLTCLAFLVFERKKVDMAVLEVGMGGRFDATNVVVPAVSVITTISIEHQRFLGNTLSQIALEKAGIIKPGIPLVCGARKKEAQTAIRKKARELSAPYYGVFDQKRCLRARKDDGRFFFVYRSEKEKYCYSPSLHGRHQGENAAVAITTAERLSQIWRKLEKGKVIKAIEETRWEGRLEIFSRSPRVLLDGAHNEEGARALRNFIREFISSPVTFVVAFMRDKKISRIADILFPLAEKVIITRFPYYRAAFPEDVKSKAQKYGDKIILEPDVRKAIEEALSSSSPDSCVIVAGSLYLVGEVKKIFLMNKKIFYSA